MHLVKLLIFGIFILGINASLLNKTVWAAGIKNEALAGDDEIADFAANKAEAAEIAQKQVTGLVLKVEQRDDKFKVKILQSTGRVVSVMINKKQDEKSEPEHKEGNAQ